MQSIVSDTDPDVDDGTQGTSAVTFTASNTVGFVALGLPDESGGMVVSQAAVGIPQYNMIVTNKKMNMLTKQSFRTNNIHLWVILLRI